MKSIKLLILLLMVTSCAPVKVSYDYEKSIDFSKYKTYNYYADLNSGLSELDTKRLKSILDEVMQSKGMTKSNAPDLFINIQSKAYYNDNSGSVGVGVGGSSGGNVGGGVSVGFPIGQSQANREIVFDFIDENGVGLIWQAVSQSNFNINGTPNQREGMLKAVVEKVLSYYPPIIQK